MSTTTPNTRDVLVCYIEGNENHSCIRRTNVMCITLRDNILKVVNEAGTTTIHPVTGVEILVTPYNAVKR